MKLYEEINKELGINFKSDSRINWIYIFVNYKLSEEFIEKCIEKLDWNSLSTYQLLSEQFIEKYANKVNWFYISGFQKLSKEFIEKYKDRIDFIELKKNILSNCERNWFVGYISIPAFYCGSFSFSRTKSNINRCVKAKIYYKDLKTTCVAYKVEKIREIEKNKICGKKDEIIRRNK